MPNKGYVYVIILREFLRAKESVIKFGCTKDVTKRFTEYPKGSKLLFFQLVDNYTQVERDILAKLREEFLQRRDIGREYFEGTIFRMLQLIYDTIPVPNNVFDDSPVEQLTTDTTPDKLTDPDVIIHAFITECKDIFNNHILKSIDVYEQFQLWAHTNQDTVCRNISHKRFTLGLKEGFNVITKPYRFEDGVAQAMFFGCVADAKSQDDQQFSMFINHHVQKSLGDYFTLKQAKDLYAKTDYCDVRYMGTKIKNKIEDTLGTHCLSQKKIGGCNYKNVFVGYRLLE